MKSLRLVIVLNLLLVLLGATPVYRSLSLTFSHFSDPLLARLTNLNSGLLANLELLLRFKDLAAANQKLNEELHKLRQKEVALDRLAQENDLLRDQLKVKVGGRPPRLVLARVVGQNPKGEVGQLVLGVGQNDGVTAGSLAVWRGNLLGTITEVSSSKSQLKLTVSPTSRFEARGLKFSARGEVWGSFGNHLKMTKVLPTQILEPGEIVIEPASGLVLGQVDQIESESPKIFKEAQLSVFYQAELLNEVFVILDDDD